MSDTTGKVFTALPRSGEEEPLTKKQNEDPTDLQFENKTFLQKLWYIKSNITVEPILAGLVIPSMLARLAIQNLNLDKTCRIKLNLGDEICDALIKKTGNNSYRECELEVQRVISGIEAWKSIIQTSLPTVLIIFMGAWSDRSGNRKICILLPIIGEFLVCVSNIISTYYFKEIPVEVTMFFEGFFPAITGGWVLMYLGVFSYISDITDQDSRTFRVGLVNLCMTAGIPIGTALSGILLELWGYYGIFLTSGTIYLLAFIYGCLRLKSNVRDEKKDNKKQKSITCLEILSLVKETVQVAVKKRSGKQRAKIIVVLITVAMLYGPGHGERIVFYLFLRYRLNWDAVMYSLYSTYSVIAHSIGALFMISVFSKLWGWHDSILCLISITSKLIGSVCTAFVQTSFQMFMVPLLEILNATTWTSMRSMASKLVSSDEMGKMNSLFSLVETLAALMFDPTYSLIYRRSISWFSGTVFIFSACMTIPAITMLIWLFMEYRKESNNVKDPQATDSYNIELKPMDIPLSTSIVRENSDLVDST